MKSQMWSEYPEHGIGASCSLVWPDIGHLEQGGGTWVWIWRTWSDILWSFAFLLKPSNPAGAKRGGVIDTENAEISTVLEMLNWVLITQDVGWVPWCHWNWWFTHKSAKCVYKWQAPTLLPDSHFLEVSRSLLLPKILLNPWCETKAARHAHTRGTLGLSWTCRWSFWGIEVAHREGRLPLGRKMAPPVNEEVWTGYWLQICSRQMPKIII